MNHRSWLIRVLGLLLFSAAPGMPHRSNSAFYSAHDLRGIEHQVHQRVNQERVLQRKPLLKWNERIASEARRHAEKLAGEGFFSHVDPSRGDVDARLDQAKIDWRRCGENLYEGNIGEPAAEAVRAWLKSSGHRKTMLDSEFDEAGVGAAVRSNGIVVIVQEFIAR